MSKNNQMTVSENQLNLITSAILLGICLFCYYPGLTGPFIFDDFPNLESLGYYNGVRNLDTLLKYLSSGFAGPTGRPLSLLSFLINSTNWPADPFSFKLTNLLLHCATGIFLFLLCRQLQLSFNTDHQKAFFIALIATSFWLLHPFFVSTVLYVIQRMAMLSAFFSVISLWFYCRGRLLMSHDLNRGYIHITLAICLGTLLAVLSKENGALLPFLILIVEYCIFHHPDSKAKPLNRFWLVFFLIVPSVIILGYIISHITPYSLSHPYPRRSFNLTERLLTEARVVTGYLHSLLIPRMNYPGVLYENILISKSLWNPVQTFFCVVFILLLPVFAVFIRKYAPLLALAILFFCTGHLLESTTLGLEIYFEHRNYLPAIFLFLPIGQLFVRYKNKWLKGFIGLMLMVSAGFTYQLSQLWGNEVSLNMMWAQQNPKSARAQGSAAAALNFSGNTNAAVSLLEKAKQEIPDDLFLHWHWLIIKCSITELNPAEFQLIKNASKRIKLTHNHFTILKTSIETLLNSQCKPSGSSQALSLLDTLKSNPSIINNPALAHQIHHLKGWVFSEINQPKNALEEFDAVIPLLQNIELWLMQVSILANHGFFPEALEHLASIETALKQTTPPKSSLFDSKMDYQKEILRIKTNLYEDISRGKTDENPNN